DWLNPNLNYVKTAHAREKIRQWFRRQQREENIARGREILEKELARLGLTKTPPEELATLLKYERVDDFLAALGSGDISPQNVALKLLGEQQPSQMAAAAPAESVPRPTQPATGISVLGGGDLLTRIARCCNPVPGEPIHGYRT